MKTLLPVVIDNWPHPPIVLEQPQPRPKRICGVFVILALRWGNERGLRRGTYFSNTEAASRAMGFWTNRVGYLLRKNRGTRSEGYARFREVWFASAKAAMKWRYWDFEVWLRKEFPWTFQGPTGRGSALLATAAQ
jgi:hypothetical protein